MTDIVQRLRGEHWWLDVTGEEAADEVERLNANLSVAEANLNIARANLHSERLINERLLAALKDAAARYEAEGDADYMMVPIRRALEPMP